MAADATATVARFPDGNQYGVLDAVAGGGFRCDGILGCDSGVGGGVVVVFRTRVAQ